MYNRKSTRIVAPATAKPVALEDLKSYLRIDGYDDDALLNGFIAAATDQIEKYLNRFVINTTLELTLDGFSKEDDDRLDALGAGMHTGYIGSYISKPSYIDLPYRPITSVTSIVTYDKANNENTFSSSAYRLDSTGGRVYLNSGYVWPADLRDYEAAKVTFICGYGATAESVPASVRHGIMQHAAAMYECRGGCDLSDSCKAILFPHRILDGMGF